MQQLKTITLFIFAVALSINANSQTYTGKQKDIQQILKNIDAFSQAYMNGEAETMANAYTSDGKIFPGRADIIGGTKDLKSFWTLSEGVKVLYHKIRPVEINIVKRTAYDFGYYEGKTQRADGSTSSFKGKYVIVWKKVEKDWKIYLDIWNGMPEEKEGE
ncbi:MAG: ketosteroid isomerase-like protein [Saprospiraceae bacterium]|jgi:ketosteroid isomerase-like protein